MTNKVAYFSNYLKYSILLNFFAATAVFPPLINSFVPTIVISFRILLFMNQLSCHQNHSPRVYLPNYLLFSKEFILFKMQLFINNVRCSYLSIIFY